VVLDRPNRYEQAGGDLLVGLALGYEFENFLLACRQASWVGPSWPYAHPREWSGCQDLASFGGLCELPRRAKINKPR
jgi:hypothetical protein